jgi:hypothetical protein
LVTIIGFSTSACDTGGGGGGGSSKTSVTLSIVSANGSSTQTTTQLTLTFNEAIAGLSANDITLSGVSGVTKGTLSNSGATYTLPLTVTRGGTLTVKVAKSGYTISGSTKTATIYYYNNNSGNTGEQSEDGYDSQGLFYELINDDTVNSISIRAVLNNAYGVSKGKTTAKNITIPSTFNNLPVTSIKDNGFSGYANLETITVPNTVKSIGNNAFSGCNDLNTVNYNGTEKEYNSIKVGNGNDRFKNAEHNCSGPVAPPEDPGEYEPPSDGYNEKGLYFEWREDIGYSVSRGTSTDAVVVIPSTYNNLPVTWIRDRGFDSYEDMKSITIPNSVTSIGDYAFWGCISLTSITIPNSVTSISNGAFTSCTSLTSIAIPNSVTSIGDYAFFYCISLTSITIPNSVMSIGGTAFYGCESLKSITLQNGLTSIGETAFARCFSLTSITIPNTVTSIGHNAFDDCSSLTSITISNAVTSISNSTFWGCSNLTSITIPNGVTSIGEGAFYGCESLTSITIPKSVTSIGNSAFFSWSSLNTVNYSGTETEWNAITIGDGNYGIKNVTIIYNYVY